MANYPQVIGEVETLKLISEGKSIARYGDGELRLATGGTCVSQRQAPLKLRQELCTILANPGKCLVGIPNVFSDSPKQVNWLKYAGPNYVSLYKQKCYVSSFITRPDSAPWIDTDSYWNQLELLWTKRHTILVRGKQTSLLADELAQKASSIYEVVGPEQDAYSEINELEYNILRYGPKFNEPIILCLGPTATVLAHRLAERGLWAMDLGHVGMFMRHRGVYRFKLGDLLSKGYRNTLREMHATKDWGGSGYKHQEEVKKLIERYKPHAIIDYGAGQCTLAKSLEPQRVINFDPGVPGLDQLPKPQKIVVCTDVLEHVEPDKIDVVLDHIFKLTGEVAYIVVAIRLANKILPDGRNAHISLHDAIWWQAKFDSMAWTKRIYEVRGEKEIRAWLYKSEVEL